MNAGLRELVEAYDGSESYRRDAKGVEQEGTAGSAVAAR